MTGYEKHKKALMKGWQTWNNESVLSHVMMPEGFGLSLGLKDYKLQKALVNVLIGKSEEDGIVTPKAHSYDGSFTELDLKWDENLLNIRTATEGDDLVILVTPIKQPKKPSSLIVNGVNLWNRDNRIRKEGDTLVLSGGEKEIRVYSTAPHNGEIFFPSTSSYLSVSLSGPVGISTGKQRTVAEIEVLIGKQRQRWETNKKKYGPLAEAYSAMQTCQAWDTVYNPETDAPNTTVSRIWNRNWGGYVLFCWDTYFAALMQSIDHPELACCNAVEITRSAADCGFVPNFTAPGGFKTYDRTQPAVGSLVCLKIYERCKERWFLEEVYPNLLSWNRWMVGHRMTKNGLLTWGSDPYISDSDHKFQTLGVNGLQGAGYESGLDDSPMFDGIAFDPDRHQMALDDVGQTGLYIADCRSLAKIAEILGDREAKVELEERADAVESALEELWDEETGIYLSRRTDTGELMRRLSPFHFHALFSHKVTEERARRIIDDHFYNPSEFWGEYILPSIARNDPSFPKQTYWQGRIWAPMNLLVYLAVLRYPFDDVKKALADKSEKLILKEWLEKGHVHENYDPDTGEGCNNPRSDPFYHWGGLLAYVALCEAGY